MSAESFRISGTVAQICSLLAFRTMASAQQLAGISLGWLEYHQLYETYKQYKKNGFAIEPYKFEKEIVNNNMKIISKMYQLFLDWEVKGEEVKAVMIRWAQDIGRPIMLNEWKNPLENNYEVYGML